jgi:DNA-binding CsgD family transcriptional regulator
VLQLLVEGRSMKEVAGLLKVTPRTVAFHKYKVMEQLRVRTTAELVKFAVKHGVVGQ